MAAREVGGLLPSLAVGDTCIISMMQPAAGRKHRPSDRQSTPYARCGIVGVIVLVFL